MSLSFGNWVKRRRKSLDLTQQELSDRVGCSLSTIVKIESDERRPSRQIAELLAGQLEIPSEQHTQFLKAARHPADVVNLETMPLPVDPAPAATPDVRHGNLPVPPTPIVGRENELQVITRQLLDPACRLLTLTGPGGVGKTRLAIEAGRQFEPYFPNGVTFIALAGVGLSESILPAIADALALTFSGPADQMVQLTAFLRTKKILLVIDNMEHLVEGANLLGEILRQTGEVKMLVTSREPLRLQWEWLFEVQGLPIPETADANFESNSAIRLFIQRAYQTSQSFSFDSEDAESLVRICKLVSGLPLAIELAASWVRVLSCSEIALDLERGLDILETRKLDVPQRHRSIKNVFDHSWKLLTADERLLLMRLSVFQGGFTREAASAALGASIAMLSSLVDKSLLRYSRSTGRYDLHELVRQYVNAKLHADPVEEALALEQHALYFASWIAALETPFKSARQVQTSQLIRAETANWLACWHWAIRQQQLDLTRKMSPCLNWYFEVHGYYDEALSVFKTALDGFRDLCAPDCANTPEERTAFAALLDQVGWFEFRKGNVERAKAFLAESLEIAREDNDPEVLYYIYGNWGYLNLMHGDIAEAHRLTTESLRYGKILNSPWHTAIPISVLGIVAYQQGNLHLAHQQLTESLNIWRSVGDPRGFVFCMLYLSMTTLALNDIDSTCSLLQESNKIAEENMDRWALAFGLDMLGLIHLGQGQAEDALVYFERSSALSEEIGDLFSGTNTMVHMGQAQAALQAWEDAQQLFLEAYNKARQARWSPVILNVLISYVNMQPELLPEEVLAVACSVLSHPAVTPELRVRCEAMRNEAASRLTPAQVQAAEDVARQTTPEEWAETLLGRRSVLRFSEG